MAHRGVVVVAADGTSVAALDLPGVDLHEVRDAPGLAALLVEHAGGLAGAAFIAEWEAEIVAAVGPLEGLAARRAADAIAGLALGQAPGRGGGP